MDVVFVRLSQSMLPLMHLWLPFIHLIFRWAIYVNKYHRMYSFPANRLRSYTRVSRSSHIVENGEWCFCGYSLQWRHTSSLKLPAPHYNDVIISAMASHIIGISIVYSTVCSSARRHWSLWGDFIGDRWPANSMHKGLVTRKIFPFDNVVMLTVSSGWKPWKHQSSVLLTLCDGKPLLTNGSSHKWLVM